jgi:hypothetical protein
MHLSEALQLCDELRALTRGSGPDSTVAQLRCREICWRYITDARTTAFVHEVVSDILRWIEGCRPGSREDDRSADKELLRDILCNDIFMLNLAIFRAYDHAEAGRERHGG